MIPVGYCQCGCGQKTTIAKQTCAADGRVKGQPNRFIKGHAQRLKPPPLDYLEDENGCWVWQRSITGDGYGQLRLGFGGPLVRAHRVYYERHVGPIPEGLVLDHLCRNRACVNPAHLEPVTLKENILRGIGTGARYGARTHCAKGHPLNGDNLYVNPASKARYCRICRAANRKRAA